MSKKDRGYCFAGITIDDMNPNNIALKNDFNHNLHLMFMTIAPLLATYCEGSKVLKAMSSHKESVKNGKDTFIDKKFSSGEACQLTYDGINRERTLAILSSCVDKLSESYSFAITDVDFTMFKSDKREIIEFVDDKIRVIYA